jgi:hypothetical protein
MRAVVALAIRLGVPPTAVLQFSDLDFHLCLACLKLENDDRNNSRN